MDKLSIRCNNNLAMFFIRVNFPEILGGSDTKIINLTQKHIRGRLAESLLMLADKYGYEDDDCTLKIYMSREDLANLQYDHLQRNTDTYGFRETKSSFLWTDAASG